MAKSQVKVVVEVTADVREFSSRKGTTFRQQVIYVDTGGKYPEEAMMFVQDKLGPLAAGMYFADQLRKEGYAFQLDLFSLKPLSADAGQAAAPRARTA